MVVLPVAGGTIMRAVRLAIFPVVLLFLSGCGFLPGFSSLEDPMLYAYSVSDVANQVTCELQAFISEQQDTRRNVGHNLGYKWVLGEDDVTVKLTSNNGPPRVCEFHRHQCRKNWV